MVPYAITTIQGKYAYNIFILFIIKTLLNHGFFWENMICYKYKTEQIFANKRVDKICT